MMVVMVMSPTGKQVFNNSTSDNYNAIFYREKLWEKRVYATLASVVDVYILCLHCD